MGNWRKALAVILVFLWSMGLGMPVQAADGNVDDVVVIEEEGQVLDTYMGVPAVYRKGLSDGSNTTYSCAAYVKKYYNAIYGVIPYNLLHNQTPTVEGDSFVAVAEPQPGDICAEVHESSNHWSIVRQVENGSVIVVEQNQKWQQGDEYVARVNRRVYNSNVTFFRLASINTGTVVTPPVTIPPVTSPSVPEGGTTQEPPTEPDPVIPEEKPEEKPAGPVTETYAWTLTAGTSKTLTTKQFALLKEEGTVTWSSKNPSVATVSAAGKVKAKKAGKTTITGKRRDGSKMVCNLTVKAKSSKPVLSLSHEDVTIWADNRETFTLKATRNPASKADTITYKSSNSQIASVNSKGIVTAKKAGTVTVTVKTKSKLTAECMVRVKQKEK